MEYTTKLTDFDLISQEGIKIPIHRIILASKSKFFDEYFSMYPEAKEMSLSMFPCVALKRAVEYIYFKTGWHMKDFHIDSLKFLDFIGYKIHDETFELLDTDEDYFVDWLATFPISVKYYPKKELIEKIMHRLDLWEKYDFILFRKLALERFFQSKQIKTLEIVGKYLESLEEEKRYMTLTFHRDYFIFPKKWEYQKYFKIQYIH